jgi:hypothetical protein
MVYLKTLIHLYPDDKYVGFYIAMYYAWFCIALHVFNNSIKKIPLMVLIISLTNNEFDDTILLSESSDDLQMMLNEFSTYCKNGS